jgi:hypothetical protein
VTVDAPQPMAIAASSQGASVRSLRPGSVGRKTNKDITMDLGEK